MASVPTRDQWFEWSGLRQLGFPNLAGGRRRIWSSPQFLVQMNEMENWPLDRDRRAGPKQQVEYALQHFSEAKHPLQPDWHFKEKRASACSIYYLRTRDVRVFGFLLGRGEFCAVFAEPKSSLRKQTDYEAPFQEVIHFIRELKIPPPKCSKDAFDDIYR